MKVNDERADQLRLGLLDLLDDRKEKQALIVRAKIRLRNVLAEDDEQLSLEELVDLVEFEVNAEYERAEAAERKLDRISGVLRQEATSGSTTVDLGEIREILG